MSLPTTQSIAVATRNNEYLTTDNHGIGQLSIITTESRRCHDPARQSSLPSPSTSGNRLARTLPDIQKPRSRGHHLVRLPQQAGPPLNAKQIIHYQAEEEEVGDPKGILHTCRPHKADGRSLLVAWGFVVAQSWTALPARGSAVLRLEVCRAPQCCSGMTERKRPSIASPFLLHKETREEEEGEEEANNNAGGSAGRPGRGVVGRAEKGRKERGCGIPRDSLAEGGRRGDALTAGVLQKQRSKRVEKKKRAIQWIESLFSAQIGSPMTDGRTDGACRLVVKTPIRKSPRAQPQVCVNKNTHG
ncbi:hypothetical protein VTH06DRAFT_6198 [Thermothelomyces fergusii]